ncbi:hypothetical protein [Bradyrhizobium cytisi]|uniref:Uncharacterized protein n=1 Tax=Bradyrhizobium cytisi TaxID=515489 RepID=A0A5S4VWX9_9BRAD|nr:hypothetical protein [Bradyrhizobium cytisi]TYL71861.1 hypothetical protein FXB38_39570 [Bradyrhizobium cytisi]
MQRSRRIGEILEARHSQRSELGGHTINTRCPVYLVFMAPEVDEKKASRCGDQAQVFGISTSHAFQGQHRLSLGQARATRHADLAAGDDGYASVWLR